MTSKAFTQQSMVSVKRLALLALFLLAFASGNVKAQVYQKVYSFLSGSPGGPSYLATNPSALVFGSNGNFYGTASAGIFVMTPNGSISTTPYAGTIWFQGHDSNLYGVNGSVLFKISAAGIQSTVANLGGITPNTLIQGNDGNFYGTTFDGGSDSLGSVFKVTPGGAVSTLASFDGSFLFGGGDIGDSPNSLIQGADGNLYGTTSDFGGTLFKVTLAGVLSTVATFNDLPGNLIQGSDGNFYGTTSDVTGGEPDTAFKATPAGVVTVLLNFPIFSPVVIDGEFGEMQVFPGNLVEGSDGNFYGTALRGGTSGQGFAFKFTKAGNLTVLTNFVGPNGASPAPGALVQGTDGNYYGSTMAGGTSGGGTTFKITSTGMLTKLVDFDAFTTPGAAPTLSVVPGSDGSFYGITPTGGTANDGTIFKVTRDGVMTTLVNFTGLNGVTPNSLIAGPDGNFYGTTLQGGSTFGQGGPTPGAGVDVGGGTVFKITLAGAFSTVADFGGTFSNVEPLPAGYAPLGLVAGSDGNFYGTTQFNNGSSGETTFQVTPAGVLNALVATQTSHLSGAGLILGHDGVLYGGTQTKVFSMTPAGHRVNVASFDGHSIPLGYPLNLTQASNGSFYGTTPAGGSVHEGSVFQIVPNGPFNTLANFSGTDGKTPVAGVVQGPDGNLYGTTAAGGVGNHGTIFQMTPTGHCTKIYDYVNDPADSNPETTMVLGPDGNLYGTMAGQIHGGCIYELVFPGAPNLSVNPAQVQGASNAQITLSANARGSQTTVNLYYSTSPSNLTSNVPVPLSMNLNGYANIPLGTTLNGLTPGTTYYYEIVATSTKGTTTVPSASGLPLTFTTPVAAALASNVVTPGSANPNGTGALSSGGSGGGSSGSKPGGTTSANLSQTSANVPVYQKEYSFLNPTPGAATYLATNPSALVLGSDGNFYGSASAGIFMATSNGSIATTPLAGSISFQGNDGNLYGLNGSTFFKITTSGVETPVANLAGITPNTLIQGSDGNFYGTVLNGGSMGYGSVFKITPAGVVSTLATFDGPTYLGGLNGDSPNSLIQGADGNLYGTTNDYGGTLFKVTLAGVLSTLVTFDNDPANLIQGSDGNFYGTTSAPDGDDPDTAFKVTPDGTMTTLANFPVFSTAERDGFGQEGENPGNLVEGTDGNFYGTTQVGGSINQGTAFKFTKAGVLTTLASFTGPNGVNPTAGALVLGPDGSFYGTTPAGGPAGGGTLFNLTPDGVVTTLVDFEAVNPHGAASSLNVVPGNDGSFYGITPFGGSADQGTIFKVSRAGVYTTLVNFSGLNGVNPNSLVAGGDGNFYGTTREGGSAYGQSGPTPGAGADPGGGIVFKITPAGVFSTVVDFGSSFNPFSVAGNTPNGLVAGGDGNFYGTNRSGYENSQQNIPQGPVIFEVTPAGVLTPLVANENSILSGAGLFVGADGNVYGATHTAISKVSPTGTSHRIIVASFSGNALPAGYPTNLMQASNGSFYGTTPAGGSVHEGSVFEITPAGAVLTLANFSGTDGKNPVAGVVEGPDGNLYGTTAAGGVGNHGTIFQMTPTGHCTKIYDYVNDPADSNPETAPILGPDGNLYGTTAGEIQGGAIYELVFPGAPSIYPNSSPVPAASSAQITLMANARGSQTVVNLYYGTSPANLTSSVPLTMDLEGFANTVIGTTLTGLTSGTTYYYQAVATSSNGTTTVPTAGGQPLSFTAP